MADRFQDSEARQIIIDAIETGLVGPEDRERPLGGLVELGGAEQMTGLMKNVL